MANTISQQDFFVLLSYDILFLRNFTCLMRTLKHIQVQVTADSAVLEVKGAPCVHILAAG